MRKRFAAGLVLDTTGLGAVLRRLDAWHGTIVLAYHRIGDAGGCPLDDGVFSATAAEFDEQMRFLAAGFDVVDPLDLAEPFDERGRRVVVTFDDGYRDNFDTAMPILGRHELRAAFFVATGLLDSPRIAWWDQIAWMAKNATRAVLPPTDLWPGPLSLDADRAGSSGRMLLAAFKRTPGSRAGEFLDRLGAMTGSGPCPLPADSLWMTWDHVRALRDAGMRIGGHTVTHPVLSRADPLEQEFEILGCRERCERELDEPMRLFSYPVGLSDSFDHTSRALLARAGVELAFTCDGGWLPGPVEDPLAIPRTPVGTEIGTRGLRMLATLPQAFARV